MTKFVAIGDSLTQGFQSGAIPKPIDLILPLLRSQWGLWWGMTFGYQCTG